MKAIKVAERGLTLVAGGLFNAIQAVNKYKPNPSFTPEVVRQAAAQVLAKNKAYLGMAEND